MQWKSLLLFLAAAGSVLARGHGRQRRHNLRRHAHPGQVAQEQHLAARDAGVETANVKTVVEVEYVTVTTTIFPTSAVSTSTTLSTSTTTAAPAPARTSAASEIDIKAVADANNLAASVSLGVGVGVSVGMSASQQTSTSSATSAPSSAAGSSWTSVPASSKFSTSGFGASTNTSGSGINYTGNVGNPWGSNIIEVTAATASQYKYVAQFTGSNTEDWTVIFWNKIGPDGKLDGWYGHSALKFTLAAGETRYVAFDENSQGGWGAAAGDSLPTDEYGGYACTWGEFDFGDTANGGWSGWDVSAIQAQAASLEVQGMRICDHTGQKCSYITSGAGTVVNAYTEAKKEVDGIGGSVGEGAVRLKVHVDYSG
ncbi:hypothetical protein BJX96DRAFT_184166 [Aspergillus floccosus]